MNNTSLVVVGSGIKFLSHLTEEAKAYITQSDKVLYLLNEPVMKEWIQSVNSNAESLDGIYVASTLRSHSYRAITEYILAEVRKNQHVCVVIYGHPTIFAQPALQAVIQAKQEGFDARVLPGISSEDCLFADLLIDPGLCGCQSFEATDFLIRQREFSVTSHLILWQVGTVGILSHPEETFDNANGIDLLLSYLKQFYSLEHEVVLYEAAQYPFFLPKIERFSLSRLHEIKISRISTLYIPPSRVAGLNQSMLSALGIDICDLN